MSRSGWCRHFTGIQNKTCKAGVDYESVRVAPLKGGYHWPCILRTARGGEQERLGTCDKLSEYTPEEIAEQEREFKAALANMAMARRAILASGKQSGEIVCPCCNGGTLRFSIAKVNGHVHAACSTANCVRWME